MVSLNNKRVGQLDNFAKTKTTMEDGKEYIELEVTNEDGEIEIVYIDMEGARQLINDLTHTVNELSAENWNLDITLTEVEGELDFLREIWQNQDKRLN
jgi:hypothetical protein